MARVHHFAQSLSNRQQKQKLPLSIETPAPPLVDESQTTLDVTAGSPTIPPTDENKNAALLWQLLRNNPAWSALLQNVQQKQAGDSENAASAGSALPTSKDGETSTINMDSWLQKDKGKQVDKTDHTEEAAALQLLGLAQEKRASTSPNGADGDSLALPGNYPHLVMQAVEALEEHKRGAWTAEEDVLLLNGIKKFGYGRWKEIANMIPGRKGKQIKQRWDNTLAPKYVDRQWLQNKIQADDEKQNIDILGQTSPQPIKAEDATHRQSNQDAIEVLLSHALLQNHTPQTSSPSTTTGLGQLDATGSTTSTATADSSMTQSGTTLNLADAALALYLQQSTNPDGIFHAFGDASHHSTSLHSTHGNTSAAAAAAAVALAAAASAAAASSSSSNDTPARSGSHKRRRSDPALAETQSDAMSIYASSAPITTTIDNETQTVYPCLFPGCGKSFPRLYNLKSHSRTHTDDRPFQCHSCPNSFSRNHDLKRHAKIHEGDKPHRCLGCNKTFSRLDALKRHKSNHRSKPACMA